MLFDFYRHGVQNNLLRGTAFTFPSHLWWALVTSWPEPDATGSTIVEPSGGSYARVQLDPSTSNYAAAAGGVSSNSAAVQFATPTGSWGTPVGVVLCDASSAGNCYIAGLVSLGAIGSGSPGPSFPIGLLLLELGSRDP